MDKNKILLCVLGIILFVVGFIIGAGASNKKADYVCGFDECTQTGFVPVEWANDLVDHGNTLAKFINDNHNVTIGYLEKFPTID